MEEDRNEKCEGEGVRVEEVSQSRKSEGALQELLELAAVTATP